MTSGCCSACDKRVSDHMPGERTGLEHSYSHSISVRMSVVWTSKAAAMILSRLPKPAILRDSWISVLIWFCFGSKVGLQQRQQD